MAVLLRRPDKRIGNGFKALISMLRLLFLGFWVSMFMVAFWDLSASQRDPLLVRSLLCVFLAVMCDAAFNGLDSMWQIAKIRELEDRLRQLEGNHALNELSSNSSIQIGTHAQSDK